MKTLIVEDDFTSRMDMQQLLAPYGETHVAVDGKEAITAFKMAWGENQPYDLICLDIMMPEMNGQDVLKEIRRLEAEKDIHGFDGAKIIMTTALNDRKNILEAFRSQCEAYLIKPIDKEKLLEHIRNFGMIA